LSVIREKTHQEEGGANENNRNLGRELGECPTRSPAKDWRAKLTKNFAAMGLRVKRKMARTP